MRIPEPVRELRPNVTWDIIKESIKLLLPFLAGLGVREWVHGHAIALMWTVAVIVAAVIAFWDRLTVHKLSPVPQKTGYQLPICTATTTEEWTKAGTELVETVNQHFRYQEVKLDGRNFLGCSFVHVSLFYDGTTPCALSNCEFDQDTVMHFHTHNPGIAQWTEIVRTLGMLKPDIKFALHPVDENPVPSVLQEPPPSCALEFGLCHAGRNFGLNLELGNPTFVEVRNKKTVTAKNVSAELRYSNSSNIQRASVPAAPWLYDIDTDQSVHNQSWKSMVDLDAGHDQSFVVFITAKEDGRLWVVGPNLAPIAILEYGDLEIAMTISADNVEGVEGTLKVTHSRNGTTLPVLTTRRSVPPRFAST